MQNELLEYESWKVNKCQALTIRGFQVKITHQKIMNRFTFCNDSRNAQWSFIAQNGMEKAPKSTVFSRIFNNGNL